MNATVNNNKQSLDTSYAKFSANKLQTFFKKLNTQNLSGFKDSNLQVDKPISDGNNDHGQDSSKLAPTSQRVPSQSKLSKTSAFYGTRNSNLKESIERKPTLHVGSASQNEEDSIFNDIGAPN